MAAEFHDLSEKFLNRDNQYWGNLGYWQYSHDYSSACEALAVVLAEASLLDKDSKVLDAGFGCGDQLLLWLDKYQVNTVAGINYSHCQTQVAKTRLIEAGYSETAKQIHFGSVAELEQRSKKLDLTLGQGEINRIIALDCAYHFPCRKHFFQSSAGLITSNGRIGLTDILLADNKLSVLESILLKTMLFLSRIPTENIIRRSDYEDQLIEAGFRDVQVKDISEHVFTPFAQWLAIYKQQVKAEKVKKLPLLFWLKYDVTAKFLTWAYRKNILNYVVVSAEKS